MKRKRPDKPEMMNGEHEAMWRFLDHLDVCVDSLRERLDRLMLALIVIAAGVVGTLLAVVLK